MLQIPSASLLQYKACSKAQQLPRGAGQLQPIKEGRQGCGGQVRGQRVEGAAEPKHRRWAWGSDGGEPGGTRPCLLGNRSLWASLGKTPSKQDVRGGTGTPSSPDWSLLGMKCQGITCPHILVTAHTSCPLGLLRIVCLGSLRPWGLQAATCPARLRLPTLVESALPGRNTGPQASR